MKYKFLLLLVIVSLYSCSGGSPRPVDIWEKEKNTRGLDVNDNIYLQAIQRAQSTLPTFVRLLNARQINGWQYFVKTRFTDGDNLEHMWVEADTVKDDVIFGFLENDPIKVRNIQYRAKVQIKFKDVEDYTIYQGDSVILGNFINHALQK